VRRKDTTIYHVYDPVVVYREDLVALLSILEPLRPDYTITITANEFELDSARELGELSAPTLDDFEILARHQETWESVRIRLQPNSASMMATTDSLLMRGLESKVTALLASRTRRVPRQWVVTMTGLLTLALCTIAIAAATILLLRAFGVSSLGDWVYAICFSAAGLSQIPAIAVVGKLSQLNSLSVINTGSRPSQSFWDRNRENLIVQIAAGLVVLLLSGVIALAKACGSVP